MAVILTLILLISMIPVLFLGVETIAAFFYSVRRKDLSATKKDSNQALYAILIPAYNEEKVIAATLTALIPQVASAHQILVVADNCNDQTAQIASQLGVTVLERFDEARRGKGYALDFGIKYLKTNACPEVVFFLDADCIVSKGSIGILINKAKSLQRPVQASNLSSSGESSSLKMRVASFAMIFKNYIRPLGLKMLKGPCLLSGTGMAFPWSIVDKLQFATGNIAEDMQMGINCVLLGAAPYYCEDVLIESSFPEEETAEKTQRTRWEHGHLRIIISEGPKLLVNSVKKKDRSVFLMGLEICVPPLSLLVLLQILVGGITIIYGFVVKEVSFMALGLFPPTSLAIIILLGWWGFARGILPSKYLLLIPWYVIQKIPIYLKFIYKPENRWIRTSRRK